MSINLALRYEHQEATGAKIRYARIDNVQVPEWKAIPDVAITPKVVSVIKVAENVPNGQYVIEATPKYSDNRVALPQLEPTNPCPGLISISASIQSGNLLVEYFAPSDIPKVLITVDYPNGGTTSKSFVNNGNSISIALPADTNGDFFVYGQSICDESTGFYSPRSNGVRVTKSSLPTVTQVDQSDNGPGSTRTQIFNIAGTITAGNRFVFQVYSHSVTVVAVTGDTPSTVAIKIRDAINATTTSQWNELGNAPANGTPGYKPVAAASGSQVSVVLNFSNQFAASAFIS